MFIFAILFGVKHRKREKVLLYEVGAKAPLRSEVAPFGRFEV
jgi:hypothetical protein